MTMPRCRTALFAAALMLYVLPAMAAEGHWQSIAAQVAATVGEVEAAFARGDGDGAKRLINEAYFSRFEDSRLEIAIRKEISGKRAGEIERLFADLRKAVTAKDAAQVKRIAAQVRDALIADAKSLDDAKVSPELFKVNQ
jgi:hypothetical protein